MTNPNAERWDALTRTLALAGRLEGEGQYNVAKLLRAAADAVARRAAYLLEPPSQPDALAREISEVASHLSALEVGKELVAALRRGGAAVAEGRLPLIDETPDGHVCRTCGRVVLGEPVDDCPTCRARPVTFQRFPPVYWLEALDPFAALLSLRATPAEITSLLHGLTEDTLTQQPPDGGWSIRQVVSHLRDAQGVLRARVDLMLSEENPALSSLAVFEWATSEEGRSPSTDQIFDDYRISREQTLQRLESIPLTDWWRTGQHEEFGPLFLHQQVSYFAAHECTHLPQIEALLERFAWRSARSGVQTGVTSGGSASPRS